MARCSGCSGDRCSCKVIAGANISVTGAGTLENPLVISAEAGGEASRLPGEIIAYGATAPPAGWLVANGAAVSRTIYAALFAIIGTTYGAGDGTTTFGLPDLAGRFPLGADGTHALGATGGAETSNALLAHTHTIAHTHNVAGSTSTTGSHSHGGQTSVTNANHYHLPFGNQQYFVIIGAGNGPTMYAQIWDGTPGQYHTLDTGSSTALESNDHVHFISADGNHSHSFNVTSGASSAANSGSAGAGTDFSIMPPWTGVTFLIKT